MTALKNSSYDPANAEVTIEIYPIKTTDFNIFFKNNIIQFT
jgi:hypothetical protein